MLHVVKNPRIRWPIATLALAVGIVLVGCSKNSSRVKGKVTYTDGKPLGGGTIVLVKADDPSVMASGEIEAGGVFEMGNSDGTGMAVGEYRALIQPKLLEDSTKAPFDPKYLRTETSGLKYTIKPGGNDLEVKLERNKR